MKKNTVFKVMVFLGITLLAVVSFYYFSNQQANDSGVATETSTSEEVVAADTLKQDTETGLLIDPGWELVKANCTACHSAALVTQNRASREGWEGMIRWMQRTQKLWDLGANEDAILDYLAKNYAPEDKGRRENLKDIEWYELEAGGR